MLEHALALLDDIHEKIDNIKARNAAHPDHELGDVWAMDKELLEVQKTTLQIWITNHNFDI